MGLFAVITAPAPVDAQRRTAQIVKKEAVEAFKAKDYRQAAILFQELYMQTSNANLLYNVGLCQQRAGMDTEALESLEKFLTQAPNSRAVGKAKKMIAELKSVVNGELINVLVRSEPAGANVFVNQRSAGMVGVTPFTLKLMPGAHTIIVDTDGYEAQSRQVSLAKDSARELFFQLFPTDQMGALKFMISERDADVMVNNRRIGRSPIREEMRLPSGSHDVLVIKPGYTTWRSKVTIKAGETNRVQIDLLPEQVITSESTTVSPDLYPMLTVTAGVLMAGGAVVLGSQAQSLYDKLESRSSQGILVHPSDKETGKTWVTWTNILSVVGGLTISGGATWWYLQKTQSSETEDYQAGDYEFNPEHAAYGGVQ